MLHGPEEPRVDSLNKTHRLATPTYVNQWAADGRILFLPYEGCFTILPSTTDVFLKTVSLETNHILSYGVAVLHAYRM